MVAGVQVYTGLPRPGRTLSTSAASSVRHHKDDASPSSGATILFIFFFVRAFREGPCPAAHPAAQSTGAAALSMSTRTSMPANPSRSRSAGKRSRPSSSSIDVVLSEDRIADILEFLPLSSMASIAVLSRSFAHAVRERVNRIHRVARRNCAFLAAEVSLNGGERVPPRSLQLALKPFRLLYSLELRACALDAIDLHAALLALAPKLERLVYEMCVVDTSRLREPGSSGSGATKLLEAPLMPELRVLNVSPNNFYWPSDGLFVKAPQLEEFHSYRKVLEDSCCQCGRFLPSYKCSRCKFFAFCSPACQELDWNSATGHRTVCTSYVGTSFAMDEFGGAHDGHDRFLNSVEALLAGGEIKVLSLAHRWKLGYIFASPGELDKYIDLEQIVRDMQEQRDALCEMSVDALDSASSTGDEKSPREDSLMVLADDSELFHASGSSGSASAPLPAAAASSSSTSTGRPRQRLRFLDEEEDEEDADESGLVGEHTLPLFVRAPVIQALARLSTLSLVRCGMHEECLRLIASVGRNLESLDISYNSRITPSALSVFTQSQCPRLRSFKARQCHRLGIEAFIKLARALPMLEVVDAEAGWKRRRRPPAHLRDEDVGIDVVWCMNGENLEALTSLLPKLRELRVLRAYRKEFLRAHPQLPTRPPDLPQQGESRWKGHGNDEPAGTVEDVRRFDGVLQKLCDKGVKVVVVSVIV